MKNIIILIVLTGLFSTTRAQVGIGTALPHPSAQLEIKASNRGILIPRLSLTGTNDVSTVATPAVSLLIYNTATAGSGVTAVTPGYYYWNGTVWVAMGNNWSLTGNTGTVDGVHFLGTNDNVPLSFRVNGAFAGRVDHIRANTTLGYQAGNSLSAPSATAQNNTAIGYSALQVNTADNNAAIGCFALSANSTGASNVGIGYNALGFNTTGGANVAIGMEASKKNLSGNNNLALGAQALYSNTTGSANVAIGSSALFGDVANRFNTAIGFNAMAANNSDGNTAIGYEVLFNNNSPGGANVGIGTHCMYANSGDLNVAIGASAMEVNADLATPGIGGNRNIAIGNGSLFNNGQGSDNIAIGSQAIGNNSLFYRNSGQFNIALGKAALFDNSTGNNNIVAGFNTMFNNQSGSDNVALGSGALINNAVGNYNVSIGTTSLSSANTDNNIGVGYRALANAVTGYNNIAIGARSMSVVNDGHDNVALGLAAGPNGPSLVNTVSVGNNAMATASNTIQLGDNNITAVNTYGEFYANGIHVTSDGRFKYAVQEDVPGLPFIMKLRPVTYLLDREKLKLFKAGSALPPAKGPADSVRHTGFIAQEVERAAYDAGFSFDGVQRPRDEKDIFTLSYQTLVVPLVKAVQEQQNIIDRQDRLQKAMAEKIERLEQEIKDLKAKNK